MGEDRVIISESHLVRVHGYYSYIPRYRYDLDKQHNDQLYGVRDNIVGDGDGDGLLDDYVNIVVLTVYTYILL